jgi:hypothetical protein
MTFSTPAESLLSPARRRPQPRRQVKLKATKRASDQRVGGRPLERWLEDVQKRLPIWGKPVRIYVLPTLTSCRGKLCSGQPERGRAVHAASFIRKRRIVLEQELLQDKVLASAILVHELFHFVWMRCGNERRHNYGALLREELSGRARGELGESAETHKHWCLETGEGRRASVDRAWRDYVCESFCDTAAWYFSAGRRRVPVTLARCWRTKRAGWFAEWLGQEPDGLRA